MQISRKNFHHLLILRIVLISIFSLSYASQANHKKNHLCLLEDDDRQCLKIQQPIEKIISLSPHATELIIASGGEKFLIGITNHTLPKRISNLITKLGNGIIINQEKIISLKPDLIVQWSKNITSKNINTPIFISKPNSIENIIKTINMFGKALQTEKISTTQTLKLKKRLERLLSRRRIQGNSPEIFLQISLNPIYTSSNAYPLYKQIFEICGGYNIFGSLRTPWTIVGLEQVIQKNPDAIIAFSNKRNKNVLDHWKKWPSLKAVKKNNLYIIDSDIIARPGPRIMDGIETLCKIIDEVASKNQKNQEQETHKKNE